MLRALLFDFNGVLVDDEPVHHELLVRVAAEEGVEIAPEVAWDLCLGRDDRSGFRAIFEHVGRELPDSLLPRLVTRKAMYYRQRAASDGFRPLPGIPELVRRAAEKGLMLGVVTGALRSEVEEALDVLGLRSVFKIVVSADDVDVGKPDPEGYRRALRELNGRPPLPERLLHPHEVAALEDSTSGVEAASAAGLWTIGIATTCPREDLAAADRVVDSAKELTLEGLEAELED